MKSNKNFMEFYGILWWTFVSFMKIWCFPKICRNAEMKRTRKFEFIKLEMKIERFCDFLSKIGIQNFWNSIESFRSCEIQLDSCIPLRFSEDSCIKSTRQTILSLSSRLANKFLSNEILKLHQNRKQIKFR